MDQLFINLRRPLQQLLLLLLSDGILRPRIQRQRFTPPKFMLDLTSHLPIPDMLRRLLLRDAARNHQRVVRLLRQHHILNVLQEMINNPPRNPTLRSLARQQLLLGRDNPPRHQRRTQRMLRVQPQNLPQLLPRHNARFQPPRRKDLLVRPINVQLLLAHGALDIRDLAQRCRQRDALANQFGDAGGVELAREVDRLAGLARVFEADVAGLVDVELVEEVEEGVLVEVEIGQGFCVAADEGLADGIGVRSVV